MAYIGIYLIIFALTIVIERLNLQNLGKYGGQVPAAFEGLIDVEELQTINQYTIDNTRFKLVQAGSNRFFSFLLSFPESCHGWLNLWLRRIFCWPV